LNRSLSVILPVNNAQSWLSEKGAQILDVVAELTDRFELLILDDGSTDATYDVARELVRRYPQVRLLREPVRHGATLAIRRAFRESRGDIVMAHDGEAALDAQEIVRLWRSLRSPTAAPKSSPRAQKAMGQSPFARAPGIRQSLETSASVAPKSSGGFRLLRPGGVQELRRLGVDVHAAAENTRPRPAGVNSRSPATESTGARRPNFLARVKSGVRDFTAGE
jgi:glycosyltransferase involved in cell wall biosynthesis